MNIQETILGLESMLFDLHPKAKGLYEAIDALKNVNGVKPTLSYVVSEVAKNPVDKPYDPKANMRNKALYAIRELNRFVKTKEIAEFLNSKEPSTSTKDFMTALSNPLYFLKNENRIHKITVGTGNNGVYWGSLKWIDEKGFPKEEFKYLDEAKEPEIEL